MPEDLKEYAEKNKILEVRCGSHLYGTNTPESDEDYCGVFMPPSEYVLGYKNVKEVTANLISKNEFGRNTKEAVDKKLYEFRHFCNLAMTNNPTILELLFTDDKNILFENEIGEALISNRKLFPSQLMVRGFLGYAKQQRHKMVIRSDKFNELEQGLTVLKAMEDNEVMADAMSKYPDIFEYRKGDMKLIWCGDLQIERGVFVKKARKIIAQRIGSATSRKELIRKHGYDTKFASHLIRLLTEGLEFINTGTLVFPLHNAEHLLDIKTGKYTCQEVIDMSEVYEAMYEEALKTTPLPKTPDNKKIEKFVISMMYNHIVNENR